MKKYFFIAIILILIGGLAGQFIMHEIDTREIRAAERATAAAREEAIKRVLEGRHGDQEVSDEDIDLFGEDGIVRILFIGLDKRAGQTEGHCDAIQMITIDQKKEAVTITAVPRGTYSPLPPGKGVTSSDYYVSNACGLGGIEYGINQIEKILGVQSDHLVIVGFSETLGILRNLKLPTTETLQWLRHRQGYAIGEPQRAHNHSTFIKQLMVDHIPSESSKIDRALQYLTYKMVQTDLSFAESKSLVDALSAMDIENHPDRITLAMKPAYLVQDIPYAPEKLASYLETMLGPLKNRLSDKDYAGNTEQEIQEKLLTVIAEKKEDDEFVRWAHENDIWLQIEDEKIRTQTQYDFLVRYLSLIPEKKARQELIGDYILEMEHLGYTDWAAKGTELLAQELGVAS